MASNPSYDLLKELNLNDYFPQKLSLSEAIKLRGKSENGCQQQYGLEIIRKLLMFDTAAVVSVTTEMNRRLKSTDAKGLGASDAVRPVEKSSRSSKWRDKTEHRARKLNPMDLLVVVMNCCDDFLRQALVEKMFVNKLSIPILLPDAKNDSHTLLLWALRSIVPEVQDRIGENSNSLTDTFVDINNPVVSFLRAGDLHRSKSKMINELLGFSSFNTFFHRECPNGSAKRSISNGSVEAAWFQSEKANEEEFNCTFLTTINLRGSARDYPKQTHFLCQSSTVVVLMVDSFESFQNLYDNVLQDVNISEANFIVCNISSIESPDDIEDKYAKGLERAKLERSINFSEVLYDWNDEEKMSDFDFTNKLKEAISDFLKREPRHLYHKPISVIENKLGFSLDEEKLEYKSQKGSADEFVNLVLRLSPDCRPVLFPLQGEPWKKIGKLEREQRGKIERKHHVEHVIAEKKIEKRRQRQIQCHSLVELNETILNFSLKFHFLQDHTLLYYLNSCKIKLHARSRVIMSNIVEEYMKWKQEYHSEMSSEEYCEVNLSKMELKIANSSIGLEHILREHGQMYEAVISEEIHMKKELLGAALTPDMIRSFPTVVARLLLKGQLLELMDGDASNVPITWLKAVLHQVRLMTNNAKVFVLSIIGVQSSGKSTLLNVLFGLQFPVSAGRCTRGIYCHLVPVDRKSLHVEYGYILVVDTEGLGSSQVLGNSIFRDNELATFAIGLADAAIINMKGENWSEMKDILQIVAHGLIRVRKTKAELKLMPRCMFVHQNVPAADAKDKNRFSQENQLLHLDKAIKAICLEEGFREITKFHQVIGYDSGSHSWYFPDLLNGKPPKASISQDYIRKANELRQYLMELVISTPSKLTVSSFFLRMSDLWNAMLHNDFVLCFRNTQEILSGTILNDKISHEVDTFKDQNRLAQRGIRELIGSVLSIEDLDKEMISRQVSEAVITNFTKMKANLDSIIETTDICTDLKQKYESYLNQIRDEELRHIIDETAYDMSVHMKKVEIGKDQNVKQLMEKLLHLEKCTDHMEKVKFNEIGMKAFEERWERLVAENKCLLYNRMKSAKERIQKEIVASASKLFLALGIQSPNEALIFNTSFSDVHILQASERDIVSIKERSVMGFMWSKSPDVSMVNNNICDVIKRWNLKFQNKSGQDFDASHWKQVMFEVGQMLGIRGAAEDKCSILPPGYKFSEDYSIKFLNFAFKYLYNRCLENSRRFISMTDPLADISERRRKSLSSYRMLLAEVNIDVVCETIFDCARNCLVRNLGEIIKTEVIKDNNENPTFKTKRYFLKTILTELCEKTNNFIDRNVEKQDIFKDFMLYIKMAESADSEHFFLDAIFKLLKKMLAKDDCASETEFQKMVKNYVGNFVEKAKAALTQAETKCNGSTMEYVRIFTQEMKVTDVILLRINTLSGFTQAVVDKLDILFVNYLKEANSLFDGLVCKKEKAALRPLFEKIMGCRERCPFCSAPCSQSLQQHPEDHRANHYPMGVNGTVDIWNLFSDTKETHDATDEKGEPEPLALDTCQTVVGSRADIRTKATVTKYTKWYHKLFKWNYHSFKTYKELAEYEKWDIPYSQDHKTSMYWKWFMAEFSEELARHYKGVCPDIPEAWTQITWEKAKESLNEPESSDSIS